MNMKKKVAVTTTAGFSLLLAGVYLSAAGVFDPNLQPVGYVAQPGITNFNLTSDNEYIFRTDYTRSDWSGNLLKVPVTAEGVVVEAAENWTGGAAAHVDMQNFDTGRKIVTLKSDGSKVGFRWANLSATQQAALGDTTTGPKILNFVRGDRSNEAPAATNFRTRGSALGAMIHSTPRHIDYGDYQTVFVGANDGMLHAFDVDTGDEAFAYVPSMLIPNLKKLAVNPYVFQHYVDGNFSIETAVIGGVNTRLLVGGLGAGGKGLYALDVSSANPASEAAAASKILWEKTNTDAGFANLGYTYGTPRITRVKTGASTSVEAVIVNNGYANNGNYKASLLVINATTGALIREIVTADSGSSATPNGLSSVRLVDTNGDAITDYVYAGDLDGQLWKFNLTADTSGSWSASKLFTTTGAQAITVAPAVHAHPSVGYMVMFATGRALTTADLTDASTHYAYGIWDNLTTTAVVATDLIQQTLVEKSYDGVTPAVRVRTASNVQPDWSAGGNRGWRTPLLGAGERVLGEGTFYSDGRFYFTSTNPTITVNGVAGENWLNQIDYLTGGSPGQPFFNLNGDAVVNAEDRVKNASNELDLTSDGVPVSKILDPGLASQPVLASLAVLDTTLFTFNPDVLIPPPTEDRGVSGGHFDVDIYYGDCPTKGGPGCWMVRGQSHFHEYDDIFDVTGVNFLNASSETLNLVKAIPSNLTNFKVLAYNQYHSPAVKFSIAGAPYVDIRDYGGLTTATFNIVDLPVHNRQNLEAVGSPKKLGFIFNLPLDAFAAKNWVGDGVRAGLVPTQTGCVNKNLQAGPLGEPRNGAITWQVVKSTTPQSALRLNVAGRPEFGWRVQDAQMTNYVLAEYTVFWHHPNNLCLGDAGWTNSPPEDTSPATAKPQEPAFGSADPAEGSFTSGPDGATTTVSVIGNVTTIVATYPDGSTRTEVRTINPDGSTTVVVTECDAAGNCLPPVTTIVPAAKSFTGTGGLQKGSQFGRLSWRDM